MNKGKWTRSAEAIVAQVDDQTGVNWDEHSNLILLARFIEDHCDQEEFETFIQGAADEEVENEQREEQTEEDEPDES